VTVFVQGALGGQVGSLRGTHPPGPDGTLVTRPSAAQDQAIGTNAAARALTALQTSGETVSDLPLSMVSATFQAIMENRGFHVAFLIHVLGPHPLDGFDPDLPIDEGNYPWIPLRATYLQVGPLGLVTAPGELHPELWVGGYDGSWSWGWPMLVHEVIARIPMQIAILSRAVTWVLPALRIPICPTSLRLPRRRTCATSCSLIPA